RRASSAPALARLSGASPAAAIRALARSRRASPRRCFINRFEPIPYSHGSALTRDASNVLRRSNAIRKSSPISPSATSAPTRRPRKRSTVAVVDEPEDLGLVQRAADRRGVRARIHHLPFPDGGVWF